MDKHTRKLDTFTKEMVKGKCGIKNFHNLSNEFEFSICQNCSFLTNGKLCEWYEYNVPIKIDFSESDDDDNLGLLPNTTYGRVIECAYCGSDITFTSGYSHLWYGDNKKCHTCGLHHYFLKRGKGNKNEIFVVPTSEYDKLYQEKISKVR